MVNKPIQQDRFLHFLHFTVTSLTDTVFSEGAINAVRSWQQSFRHRQASLRRLLMEALASALPGWGVNGFYLSDEKQVRSKQPKNSRKEANPGLRSRVLISCQAQRSSPSCGSAEARQEQPGARFLQDRLRCCPSQPQGLTAQHHQHQQQETALWDWAAVPSHRMQSPKASRF